MPTSPRTVIAASLSLLLPLSSQLTLSSCAGEGPPPPPPPREVGVVTIRSMPVELTVDLPGRVAAVEVSEVRPQVDGIIRERLFQEGSQVRAGQLLYVIEDAPFRAELVAAEGQLASARATIESTRLQAERYQQLVGANAVSRQEADDARAAALQAVANAEAQRGNVERARVNMEFTRLRAPISGRIGRSVVTVGALVQEGQAEPLATVQRTDPVYVDVTQSAAELLDLRQALARGEIERGAGRESARMRLVLPNGAIYTHEGALGFSEVSVEPTTGTVTLRARFPNPDGLLLPGMYVRAQLVEGVRPDAVLAPQQGVTRDPRGRGSALVVNAANEVERREVDVGRAIGGDWIVHHGLRPGDRLIVEGLLMLQPGQQVVPRPPEQVRAAEPGREEGVAEPGAGAHAAPRQDASAAPAGGSGHSPDAAPGTASDDRRN